MSKKEAKSMARRDFFRKAGFGAGVAGAAAVGLSATGAKAAEPTAKKPNAAGYRESKHVKTYYKLARF
jgi:hypothetical protein